MCLFHLKTHLGQLINIQIPDSSQELLNLVICIISKFGVTGVEEGILNRKVGELHFRLIFTTC